MKVLGNGEQDVVPYVKRILGEKTKSVITLGIDRMYRDDAGMLLPQYVDRYSGVSVWSNETKTSTKSNFTHPVTMFELNEGGFHRGIEVAGVRVNPDQILLVDYILH